MDHSNRMSPTQVQPIVFFYKCEKAIKWRKDGLFNKMILKQIKEPDLNFKPYTKINSSWI